MGNWSNGVMERWKDGKMRTAVAIVARSPFRHSRAGGNPGSLPWPLHLMDTGLRRYDGPLDYSAVTDLNDSKISFN